jgi:hypothetical protein
MSEINKIYEITQLLSSPENIKNDLNEITDMVFKHFSTKYLSPINAAMASDRQYYNSHPNKEINLLNALKPFWGSNVDIDKVIDAVNTLRIFSDITSQGIGAEPLQLVTAAAIEDSAIHSDGIYEIDQDCAHATAKSDEGKPLSESSAIILLLVWIILKA